MRAGIAIVGLVLGAMSAAMTAPPPVEFSPPPTLDVPDRPVRLHGRLIVLDDARPIWRRRPSAADLERVIPESPLPPPSGRATVACVVGDDGRLSDCFVMDESPTVYSYGEAAMKLAPLFVAERFDFDGVLIVGKRIAVPFAFDMAGEP